MKGILKSRPSTPAPSDSSVGEKSKELADKALNLINPARKYKKRRRELFKASAANRSISEVVQSRRRPLLGPSPGAALPHFGRDGKGRDTCFFCPIDKFFGNFFLFFDPM